MESEKSSNERAPSRKSLLKRAYRNIRKKLDAGENGKTIDDLVKLLKAEKDLGGEEEKVREIKVRWEAGDEESSKGE